MRLKAQYVFVIAIAVVATLYFLVRAIFGGGEPATAQAKAPPPKAAAEAPSV